MSNHSPDLRQHFPATLRNRQPILQVLQRILPPQGDILEIASGSGEHGVFFAPHFAPRRWIPSDLELAHRQSIKAWKTFTQTPNLELPLALDMTAEQWWHPLAHHHYNPTAICCINLIHIAPWAACVGLFRGAAQLLKPGNVLYLYGPYRRQGVVTAPSNEGFDQSLKARNGQWGLRQLETVAALAQEHGFSLGEVVEMPANNLSVIFYRV